MEDRIKIIAISDRVCSSHWSDYNPSFMKQGWVTWCDARCMFTLNSERGLEMNQLYIEDNRYRMDFYQNAFEVYHESPYQRKLREKQERRDEVIKQSEIKHKVTLVRISI